MSVQPIYIEQLRNQCRRILVENKLLFQHPFISEVRSLRDAVNSAKGQINYGQVVSCLPKKSLGRRHLPWRSLLCMILVPFSYATAYNHVAIAAIICSVVCSVYHLKKVSNNAFPSNAQLSVSEVVTPLQTSIRYHLEKILKVLNNEQLTSDTFALRHWQPERHLFENFYYWLNAGGEPQRLETSTTCASYDESE